MPSDTWPVDTPVPTMLDRVRGRAKQRRHRRHTTLAGLASVLTVLMATALLASAGDGFSLRTTTPADGDGSSIDNPSVEGPSGAPEGEGRNGTAGRKSAGGGGRNGSDGRVSRPGGAPLGSAGEATGLDPALPNSVPGTTTTSSPPRASIGDRDIAFVAGYQLWLVGSDGSQQAPLTAADPAHRMGRPDWSHDGTRLVAFDYHFDVSGKSRGTVSIVDRNGNSHPLTEEGQYAAPRWSPDGARIAYGVARPRVDYSIPEVDIWVMNADGSNPRELTGITGNQFDWMPDSRRLLSWCETGDVLCTADVDDNDVRQVPNSSGLMDFAPAPDGQRLAIYDFNDGDPYVGTMQLDGSGRRVLLDGWSAVGMDWSPDSRTIVFSGAPDSEPPPSNCIYTTESVTDNCPDPEHLRIWRIDADGSNRRPLTTDGISGYWPSWRPTP